MKAVIYTRTSVDEIKNPRASNSTQEQFCRKRAEEEGDEIIEVYSDIGISGGGTKKRKAFLRMNVDADKKYFERFYTLDLTRLARNLKDQEICIDNLQSKGISVFTCEDGCLDEKNKLLRQIKGSINEEMRNAMRRRTEIEHSVRLAKHIPVSRPPLGYKINKKTKRWDIDINGANIVKKIFDFKLRGLSVKEISKEMKMFSLSVKKILKNESYIGIYTYRKESFENHEPIIEKEVFERCQM